MKRTKRLATLLLALVMIMCLSVTAFAESTGSITIENAQEGETYKIYKMLDLSVNEDFSAFTYTVNEKWKDFFTGVGAGAAYVDIDEQGYVTWKGKGDAAEMEAFAKAAAAYAAANDIQTAADSITPASDSSITFENLAAGYYLITSTNGTLAMVDTTPTKPNPSIKEKNPDPTIDKQVQEDSTGAWGDENSAQIGDTVNFRTTFDVKHGAKNYVMHDKMEDGLTFIADSVSIDGLTKDTDYTVVTATEDGCTFEIRFEQTYLDKVAADTELVVSYSAVLNENASTDITNGEKNDAKLTWGDKSGTEWDTTITKTYQFSVLKYAGADAKKNPLAGAVFQLKDATGNIVKLIKVNNTEYRVANGDEEGAVETFVTVGSNKITITGVDLDKYTLVEITAPAGYNKLSAPVEVTVNANNALTVEVANNAGTELPSTGGIGTTIFYVLGGILAVGAAVLLATKKRMDKSEG